MAKLTDDECQEIRRLFMRLADIQADATIAKLEADTNAQVIIDVPKETLIASDIRALAGLPDRDPWAHFGGGHER